MPCERCWKQNPADVHTCTASREYMLDIIQKEIGSYIQHWWAIEWWWWKVYNPVMIWDVLDRININIQKSFIEENPVIYDWLDDYRQDILYKWTRARDPIDSQSDECVCYIYSLLPPEVRK